MTDQTDNDESQIDNVLAFTKRFDENADIREMRNLTQEPKLDNLPYRCMHMKLHVDSHHRSLTCRRCGAIVDPFDWINSVADGETKVEWELKALRREITDHREGLERLKREEVNTRARIRNAQFKLNDVQMQLSAADKSQEGNQ